MMPATRAAELGIVHAAVDAAGLDERVAYYVDNLMRGTPGALAATKAALRAMTGAHVDDAVRYAKDNASGFATPEAREGVAAFMEKRPASWMPQP